MIWLVLLIMAIAVIAVVIYWSMNNNGSVERYEDNHQMVLFKTHVWNEDIERFVRKIERERNCDLVILAHSDDKSLIKKIKDNELKRRVIMITESDIRSVYEKGFVSLWLSNHWNTMWYYKKYPNYQYYWTIEYDVRIVGDSSKIWNYPGSEDFIFPHGAYQNPYWQYKNDYVGGVLTDETKWYGYLQLARYSNRFLAYLDSVFEGGENGQDEMMMFSLWKRDNAWTGGQQFLKQFVDDSWTVDYRDSDKNHRSIEKAEKVLKKKPKTVRIFHPVK